MTPLILIPGHMCGPWLYAPQMAAFPSAALADVTQDDSVQGMAARLLADTAGQLILAGLSLGAMVAIEAMAQAPERVAGACVMATDPTPAREKEVAWRQGLLAEGLDHYRQTFVGQFFRHDPAVADRLGPQTLSKMAETPEDVTRTQARALDTRRDMAPLIASYPGPVEIVVGSEDRVCPPRLHVALADALSQANLEQVDGAGHILSLEAPEASNQAISRLLDRLAV